MRVRGMAIFLAVATEFTLAAVPAGEARADSATVTIPEVTCADGNFFDGLDTRSAASYCASASSASGWGAVQQLTNTQAAPALETEARDGGFAHAGHAIVTGSGNNATALASLFPGAAASGTTVTSLLGALGAADLQGPGQICNNTGGNCRDVTFVTAPYNSEMQKFDFAIFMSCNSAHDGVGGFNSLATVAYSTGHVGTAIGFYNEVSWIANAPGDNVAGDAFARKFWGDLRSGTTWATALADGANAGGGSTYGWSTYREDHQSNAQNHLSPSGYYVP
jgi:hypothetical protein